MTSRRSFLSLSAALAATSCTAPAPKKKQAPKTPTLLVRSGWQTENIGDIAHTPGLLRLIQQHFSGIKVILWSNATDRGVAQMLTRNFEQLEIISGQPDSDAVKQAFLRAGFLLHGSGPSVVAREHVDAWRKATSKPYGILGVTVTMQDEAASKAIDDGLRDLLENASFVYTRETASLQNLKWAGIRRPVVGFAPDATFSIKLSNEEAAKPFLDKNGLEPKRFIAVVPRLRFTPYHKMRKTNWSEEMIRQRTKVNLQHQEQDHAKLREAMIAWVRQTGYKVLLCPEMTYQLEIIDPLLYNPLPADVKAKVVRRKDYWITDEASSVYRRAVAVLSFECHSPIIASANDTPSLYIRQPQDGIKGQMWTDLGLGQWAPRVEETTGAQITEALMKIHNNYNPAQVDVHEAVVYARRLQAPAMDELRKVLYA
ncbi:MAG: polysaccharide pyruvyl transferase family protein [Acidimicrobiia bacterium]|nr:polysaccharide pyruvyl transferase family protein [Acidimicrobiia bacterium]